MSDQADHLRQLVRAHRAWRELARDERCAAAAVSCSKPTRLILRGQARGSGPSTRDLSLWFWAARAARWALGHMGR